MSFWINLRNADSSSVLHAANLPIGITLVLDLQPPQRVAGLVASRRCITEL
jgi:hypothetical protein